MRLDRRNTTRLLGIAGALLTAGVLLIALAFTLQARSVRPRGPSASSVRHSATSVEATRSSLTTSSSVVTAAPAPSAATSQATAVPSVPAAGAPSLDAYRGLGAWVDLYDATAWDNPAGAIADMASHGVHTLFLETSNSRAPTALKDASELAAFIRGAHARNIRVVAWYLPSMKQPAVDFSRIAQAIAFRTPEGQGFDSFALDIEASSIRPVAARNAALNALSARIRTLVGPSYALGAIIPSPSAIAEKRGYWDRFPYSALAVRYDVFLPMSYYTYHGNGAMAASADTISNVRILRAQKGCSAVPVHLVGGLASDSSAAEVRAFVGAAKASGVIGLSLYDWVGTNAAQWRELSAPR